MQRLTRVDSVYIYDYTPTGYKPPKDPGLYMFDLDDTLITTASGEKFPTDAKDWKWKYQCVPDTLATLATANTIIIITNQAGISKGTISINTICEKLQAIACAVPHIAFSVYISTREDKYRKPAPGIFDIIAGTIKPPKRYHYIGDAAGRVATNISKKDFSCSDRKFAHNIGAIFATPEEFFLGAGLIRYVMEPDPARIYSEIRDNVAPIIEEFRGLDMVILVGAPASGKTTFARGALFRNYLRVSADDLGSVKKCISAAADALGRGVSVIVDNTNPGKTARAPFIEIAKKHNARVHIIEFKMSRECAEQLGALRVYSGGKHIPALVYNIYAKQYESPDISDGADLVTVMPFVPNFTESTLKQFLYYI